MYKKNSFPIFSYHAFDDARVFLGVEHMCTKKRG